jgi:hypothetical protein
LSSFRKIVTEFIFVNNKQTKIEVVECEIEKIEHEKINFNNVVFAVKE